MTQGIYIQFHSTFLVFFFVITGVCLETMTIGKGFGAITGVCLETMAIGDVF